MHADFRDEPGSAEVSENMRHSLLAFHGVEVGVSDPRLTPWLGLWESAYGIDGSAQTAWQVTCVALFTHPDFYSY